MDLSTISDNQAEATVVATLLYHPDFILHSESLKPKYFYHVENGCLYWAIEQLTKSGITTIDALNITNIINSNSAVRKTMVDHNLEDIQSFITMSEYAARHTLEEYKMSVNQVITMSFKRDLVKASHEIESKCYNMDSTLKEANDLVNKKITALLDSYLITDEIKIFGSQIDDLYAKIRNRNASDRIPSRYSLFDDYFKYDATELVCIKARMKSGKSAFLLNESLNAVENMVPTMYFDTEMSDESVYKRVISSLTGIRYSQIDNNTLTDTDIQKIQKANEWLKERPFVHQYVPGWDDDEIYAICKKLKYQIGLRFVVFDYLKSNVASSSENYNILGARADFLKNRIAGELNLAVVTGAQLNRNNQTADSDKIDRYLSTSITWRYKTSDEIKRDGLDSGNILAYIDLNRNGPMMDEEEAFSFIFDGDHMRIKEAVQPKRTETPFDDDGAD